VGRGEVDAVPRRSHLDGGGVAGVQVVVEQPVGGVMAVGVAVECPGEFGGVGVQQVVQGVAAGGALSDQVRPGQLAE
jgi:hypothetical protein